MYEPMFSFMTHEQFCFSLLCFVDQHEGNAVRTLHRTRLIRIFLQRTFSGDEFDTNGDGMGNLNSQMTDITKKVRISFNSCGARTIDLFVSSR